MNEAASEELYCQFGKRFLDGFSWLAPLTNNRLGDALNIEFVHEQLFFIQGDRVLDNVGYSEKGTRFNEAQFGKPIHSLEDLGQNGYWLVGRRFIPTRPTRRWRSKRMGIIILFSAINARTGQTA